MDGKRFIQVLVPLRLEWVPCYSCDEEVKRGQRVTVSFSGKAYAGVVWNTDAVPDVAPSRIRKVLKINTELPSISPQELSFWEFLSTYYLCSPGEVFKAAYPGSKIRSEQVAASILDRLRSRLAVREEALSRKHKDNVRERLQAERDAIAAQIEALTRIPEQSAGPKSSANHTPSRPILLVGPGRHEEYVNRAAEAVQQGLNVLVLTPEIAASEQLSALLEQKFPGIVHSLNSHVTDARRRRVAEDLRSFGGQIVVGTRTSLFLPFSRLGLIIVENEQDVLFKQTEPSPRYNGRDAAVMLGRIHGASVVLGTPAPSLESLHNALSGKYELLNAGGAVAPVTLIDISVERRKNGMPGRMSRKLIEAVQRTEGPIALVRGWEKPDEILDEADRFLPGRPIDIFTFQEARQRDLKGYPLVAVLQADALMGGNDFRADERAIQTIAMLREACSGILLVQTAKGDHPVFGDTQKVYAALLAEREQWSLPPYTRLVDVTTAGDKQRHVLPADATLAARKKEILQAARQTEQKSGGRTRVIIDVDPVA
ncbi:MAG: hypothetical protein J6S62_06030 [Bacteroidales bacterium]|nr:hypothetical protein [Bacteroidales bacterium]